MGYFSGEVVGKARLARSGKSRDHHQPAGLEAHQMGEAIELDAGKAGHAVFLKFEEGFLLVVDRHHAHGHLLFGAIHAIAHLVFTMHHQHLVGILAATPIHIPELIVGKILGHLPALLGAFLVVIACIHNLHAAKVLLVGIETGHARAAAVGQRDHRFVAALHEHRRVHHTLGNIDRRGAQHAVDVIRRDATATPRPAPGT